jgi:hypothetical protein
MTPRPLRTRTPCCNIGIRLDKLDEIGNTVSRKCRNCGACYRVTLTEAHLPGITKLEWRQTRSGVFSTADNTRFGVKPPTRRRRQ